MLFSAEAEASLSESALHCMLLQMVPACPNLSHRCCTLQRTCAAAGGTAGAVAWASVYPLDLIKSRLQATTRAASQYDGGVL